MAAKAAVSSELGVSSERYLAALGSCLAELELNRSAGGGLDDESEQLVAVLPEVMSISALVNIYLLDDPASVAPRTFWWLKQFVLDPPLGEGRGLRAKLLRFEGPHDDWGDGGDGAHDQGFGSGGSGGGGPAELWPLLLHLLLVGELEAAARLLVLSFQRAQRPGVEAQRALGHLKSLLEARAGMPPFVEPTPGNMAAVGGGHGAALGQWRRVAAEVCRSDALAAALPGLQVPLKQLFPGECGTDGAAADRGSIGVGPYAECVAGVLEGLLVGDGPTLVALARDGRCGVASLLQAADQVSTAKGATGGTWGTWIEKI